jgi:hypothetical protein
MILITFIYLFILLFTSPTFASTIDSHPSKAATWMRVPQTLQDPSWLKRDSLDERRERFPLVHERDIVRRQSNCTVVCEGGICCPTGWYCTYDSGVSSCCQNGHTCVGKFSAPSFTSHIPVRSLTPVPRCSRRMRGSPRSFMPPFHWRVLSGRSNMLPRLSK